MRTEKQPGAQDDDQGHRGARRRLQGSRLVRAQRPAGRLRRDPRPDSRDRRRARLVSEPRRPRPLGLARRRLRAHSRAACDARSRSSRSSWSSSPASRRSSRPASIGLTIQLVRTVEEEIAIYRRWFGEHRVDGVFVVDVRHDDPRVEALDALGLPAVVIGGPLPGTPLPAVWHDEASVVVEAVQYLAALGHRRIARVSGVAEFVHTAERTRAFRETVDGARARGRGRRHRLHARERHPRDPAAALVARAADRDHLRQRPPRRHGARCRAADGIQRPRRPLADRLGRFADQPRRPSAADRDHARHRRLRRHGRPASARRTSTAPPRDDVEVARGELTPRGSTAPPRSAAARDRPRGAGGGRIRRRLAVRSMRESRVLDAEIV